MYPEDDSDALESALYQLETVSTNFAYRLINDSNARASYISQTQRLAHEYRQRVALGQLSPQQAAQEVQVLRNQIMELQRAKLSDIGRAYSVELKNSGITLEQLQERYSEKRFNRSFSALAKGERGQVHLDIIEASGRQRPQVNRLSRRLSSVGRGLWLTTVAIAAYDIASADDKPAAIARQGASVGGGILGGAAAGAVAGLVCGPGAPICSGALVVIGGVAGAWGGEELFDWARDD